MVLKWSEMCIACRCRLPRKSCSAERAKRRHVNAYEHPTLHGERQESTGSTEIEHIQPKISSKILSQATSWKEKLFFPFRSDIEQGTQRNRSLVRLFTATVMTVAWP